MILTGFSNSTTHHLLCLTIISKSVSFCLPSWAFEIFKFFLEGFTKSGKMKLHFRPQETSKLWKTPKIPEIITNHFYNKNMIIDSEWDLEQIGLRTKRDWFCCDSSNTYTTDYLKSRTQDRVGKTDKLSDFWKSILVHNWRLDPDPCLNCGGDTSQPYWKKAIT